MKKESWNTSYAKLALQHRWGGIINTLLACLGFCYLVNFIATDLFNSAAILGSFTHQFIIIVMITMIHTFFVPKLAKRKF